MKKLTILLAAVLATTTYAASSPTDPETAGSDQSRAAAEAAHMKKTHGLKKTKEVEAQSPANEKTQAAAEAKHLKKKHGNINDTADQVEKTHPQH